MKNIKTNLIAIALVLCVALLSCKNSIDTKPTNVQQNLIELVKDSLRNASLQSPHNPYLNGSLLWDSAIILNSGQQKFIAVQIGFTDLLYRAKNCGFRYLLIDIQHFSNA